VKKQLGCTWVELKDNLHVFLVNDQECPQMHSYDILGARMLWKPKEAQFYRSTSEHSGNIRLQECFDKMLYHINL
jgi:hypothetical protein